MTLVKNPPYLVFVPKISVNPSGVHFHTDHATDGKEEGASEIEEREGIIL